MPRKVNITIAALAAISAVLLVITSGEPLVSSLRGSRLESTFYALSWPNTIVFNLSVGYLSSVFFWVLVVYLPERSRRRLLRETLARRYTEFKREIVQIFLWASGECPDAQIIEKLPIDHVLFKEYFGSGNKRWYAVLNGIQGSELRMHELSLAMKIFANEVTYLLNNLSIDDPFIYGVLKQFNENIIRKTESGDDLCDRVKSTGSFLWRVLARWSLVEGQTEDDIIEKIIERI